jgi:hypothetical protein
MRGEISKKLAAVCIVVAHPDDEVLWFSSVLKECKKIVICFGDVISNAQLSKSRADLFRNYPLSNIHYLNIAESGAFLSSNWQHPLENDFGMKVGYQKKKYNENYCILRKRLQIILKDIKVVYTHNPWGEYGHEEHVQVYRVIESLKFELGYSIYVSGYFSDRTVSALSKYYGRLSTFQTKPIDVSFVNYLKISYMKFNCWTWDANYVWPEKEIFFSVLSEQDNLPTFKAFPPMSYIHLNENKKKIIRILYRLILPFINNNRKNWGNRKD